MFDILIQQIKLINSRHLQVQCKELIPIMRSFVDFQSQWSCLEDKLTSYFIHCLQISPSNKSVKNLIFKYDHIHAYVVISNMLLFVTLTDTTLSIDTSCTLNISVTHSGKPAAIRESNHGSGVCKEHYA